MAVAIVAIAAVVLAACSADSGIGAAGRDATDGAEDGAGSRVIDPDRVLTFDDFKAAGFKKSKTYDVSELPGAEAAYYGFWGLDPYDRDDFEFRVYASQAEAMELGTELAGQRTGSEALLTTDSANWKVGLRDARKCAKQGQVNIGSGDCTSAKYYDYMFVGNVILFCPGLSLNDARKNCEELLVQMQ